MTNFEKIKQMSDEDFVKLLGGNCLCDHIQDNYKEFCDRHCVCMLEECCMDWLESEAIDGEEKNDESTERI